MNPYDSQPTPSQHLKQLKARFRFRFKPRLSQNFLLDPRALDGIAEAAGGAPGKCVVEVGAGGGFLTERLLRTGARVVAVEIDRELIPLLRSVVGFAPRLRIVNADILDTDLAGILREEGVETCSVAGNLPYHVTAPVIFHLLGFRRHFDRIVVTVQKEVAARMAAKPGTKEYGALSVAIEYSAECERLFEISPNSFAPRPEVRSTVVRLVPRTPALEGAAELRLFSLVKSAFGQRRKMLVNSVAETSGGKENAISLLKAAGLDPARRGETLSLDEFIRLAKAQ